jgi:hypothetical protein
LKIQQGKDIKESNYRIVGDSKWGVTAIVDSDVISITDSIANFEQSNRLTINNIGRYLLASDWCIWITCKDESIRRRAAIQQSLEWLNNSVANPQVGDIEKFILGMNNRLSISRHIMKKEVLEEARRKRLDTAIERLESETGD